MYLRAGTQLGPYQIVSGIGHGGMGEVYRGTDSRLGRDVAIKILSERLANRDDVRARFDREARAVSQLNHQHICTLHDVGEATVDGASVHYLVMELLDGETLADRIAKGPLALDLTLRYAIQIADALDRAHRSGIVHRDLKPGNIMITSGGVKLLDFGLAKTLLPPSFDSATPTAQAITGENVLLGTLQYMSPEQLTGRAVDARSDIFAFGAVLYEMVTAQRAFAGTTQASVIAAIVHDDPQRPSELRPVLPAALDEFIALCLAKDPEERFQNARDVMLQLRSVNRDAAMTAGRSRSRVPALLIAAATGILIGAMAVFLLPRSASKISPRPRHLMVEITPPLPLVPNGFGAPFDIAPDGSQLAWVGVENSTLWLFVRRFESLDIQKIPQSEQANAPFFSPDGNSVGFFSKGQLRVASLRGDSSVRDIAAVGPGAGATWMDDQSVVFAPLPGGGLSRVNGTGGKVETVTVVDAAHGEAGHAWPFAIRGTRTFLFTIERDGHSWDEAQIAAYSLDTKEKRIVLVGGTRPRYAGGKLYFARGNQIMVVPFNPKTLEVIGVPAAIVDGVVAQPGTGGSFFAVAGDGTIAYLRGGPDFFATRVLMRTQDGNVAPLDMPLRTYANPRLSHDGAQLAVQLVSANDDVWVYHRHRRTFTRVTAQGENLFPNWSPDDRSFLVSMFLKDSYPLLVNVPIAGASAPKPVAPELHTIQIGTSWSSSGRIAFSGIGETSGFDIYIIDRLGASATPLLQTPFNEHEASLSPDGRFFAYTSDESGGSQIYLRAVDHPAEKLQLSIVSGREPLWSRDGHHIYFRDSKGFLAVDITVQGSSASAGTPRRLFDGDFVEGSEAIGYDVGADGTFILLQRNGSAADGSRLQLRLQE